MAARCFAECSSAEGNHEGDSGFAARVGEAGRERERWVRVSGGGAGGERSPLSSVGPSDVNASSVAAATVFAVKVEDLPRVLLALWLWWTPLLLVVLLLPW